MSPGPDPDSIAIDLLGRLRGVELEVVRSELVEEEDHSRHSLILRLPAPAVSHAALGLIFALGALSFDEARAQGNSIIAFRERDEWTADDVLRGLAFDGGDLRFDADYVRGRMMKTRIRISSDGTVVISTLNRGDRARHWVDAVLGVRSIPQT